MIYLFNSAYRDQYTKNVFRTLFFPAGWINTYTYDFQTQPSNINPADVDEFEKLIGDPVAITFIDRFSPASYSYHPMRLGKLASVEKRDGRLYFKVTLADFFYPINAIANSERMQQSLPSMPRLTANNPLNTHDGTYAIILKQNIFADKIQYYHGESAWGHIIDNIQHAQVFSSSESVFLKANLYKQQNRFERWAASKKWTFNLFNPLQHPKAKNDTSYFNISKSDIYRVEILGRYPKQLADAFFSLSLTGGDTLKFIDKSEIKIGNSFINDQFQIASKRYPEDDHDRINFNLQPNGVNHALGITNEGLTFRLSDTIGFWAKILLALLVIVIGNIISGINITSEDITFEKLLSTITAGKIIGAVTNVIGLFWIFRLIGKKVF